MSTTIRSFGEELTIAKEYIKRSDIQKNGVSREYGYDALAKPHPVVSDNAF